MNTWLGSCVLTIIALTLGAAQDFDFDTESLLIDGMVKRRSELFGKRDGLTVSGFGREIPEKRRTRELFGKRSFPSASINYLTPSLELPAKRRTRELFGKRSVEMNPLTSEQIDILATMIMDRPRRARSGGELFGK